MMTAASHRRVRAMYRHLLLDAAAGTASVDEPDLTHAEKHRRSLALLESARPEEEEEPWRALPPLELTAEQLQSWETFGFLALPGLLADRAQQIIDDFEEVWAHYGGGHDGQPHDNQSRSCIVPFLDSHPRLCSLLDDPRIVGLATALLGEDFNLMGSDGNCKPLLVKSHHNASTASVRILLLLAAAEPCSASHGGSVADYAGDTQWHSDGGHAVGDPIHIKIAFYLDHLTRDTG